MKRLLRVLTVVAMLAASTAGAAGQSVAAVEATDSAALSVDSLPPLHGNWLQQLAQADYHINDPRIRYPRFVNFCRKVYNWGNDTFNTFDPAYVTGTGKNWKVTVNGSAWAQAYGYLFDFFEENGWNDRVILRSNLNYDMGIHLSFMAVSIGYTWNVNQLLGHNDQPRSTFNFAFNCARFSAEVQMQSLEGNTYIERFGAYNGGRKLHVPLNDVHTDQLSVRAYYYFNHRKYAQAAVYAFSKYQKRSAGTWMLGAGYGRQRTDIDFSGLPDDMLAAAPPKLPLRSVFNFHDFEILGGYGFNAVMPHNWVFNITLLPSVGYRRSLNAGRRRFSEMVSTNAYGRAGLIYNHRAFFANVAFQSRVGFVFDSHYSFVNLHHDLDITFGVRF